LQRFNVELNKEKAVRMFGDDPDNPNKTFSELPRWEDLEKLTMVQYMTAAISRGFNLLIEGPSGCGKTEFGKHFVPCFEVDGVPLEVVYYSCVLNTVESLKVAFPYMSKTSNRRMLRYLIDKRLLSGRPTVLIWDEVGQADPELYSAMMEVLSERTIGNVYPNLVSNIMFDNPQNLEYGRLNSMEFAQASRFGKVSITANDSPWARAVAQRYTDYDLKKVIKFHNSYAAKLDKTSQQFVNPRVLTQGVLYCLTNGVPGEFGLPWWDGKRVELLGVDGSPVAKWNTTRDQALSNHNEAYIAGIADALGVVNPDRFDNPLERSVDLIVRDGISVYVEGKPGCGKTSAAKALFASKYPDIKIAYLSLGNTFKEDVVIPFPCEDAGDGDAVQGMDNLTFDFFDEPGPKIGLFDEYTRGTDDRITNVINEIVQGKSTNGKPIPDYVGSLALNNPRTHAGRELDVRTLTLPQSTRFSISFSVSEDETKSFAWLEEHYGEPIRPFVEWVKESLHPAQRDNVPARVLELMFVFWEEGLDMRNALPTIEGERVEVPIGDLLDKLNDKPLARLTAMSKELDRWVGLLGDRDDAGMSVNPDSHLNAYKAFLYAEMGHLKDHWNTCVEIFKVIDEDYRYRLLSAESPDVQQHWYDVLAAAIPDED
jgi:MoxR-like ATPase